MMNLFKVVSQNEAGTTCDQMVDDANGSQAPVARGQEVILEILVSYLYL